MFANGDRKMARKHDYIEVYGFSEAWQTVDHCFIVPSLSLARKMLLVLNDPINELRTSTKTGCSANGRLC